MPYADKGGGEFCRGVSHEVSLLILDTDFLLVLALSTWMRCVATALALTRGWFFMGGSWAGPAG